MKRNTLSAIKIATATLGAAALMLGLSSCSSAGQEPVQLSEDAIVLDVRTSRSGIKHDFDFIEIGQGQQAVYALVRGGHALRPPAPSPGLRPGGYLAVEVQIREHAHGGQCRSRPEQRRPLEGHPDRCPAPLPQRVR